MAKNSKNRRNRLYLENPNCKECGVLMILPDGSMNIKSTPNMAVLYHTISKTDELGIPSTILLCAVCANKKNDEKQSAIPIEILRVRSSAQGMCTCSCGNRHIKSVKD